jgi:hypothetical protein
MATDRDRTDSHDKSASGDALADGLAAVGEVTARAARSKGFSILKGEAEKSLTGKDNDTSGRLKAFSGGKKLKKFKPKTPDFDPPDVKTAEEDDEQDPEDDESSASGDPDNPDSPGDGPIMLDTLIVDPYADESVQGGSEIECSAKSCMHNINGFCSRESVNMRYDGHKVVCENFQPLTETRGVSDPAPTTE